MGIFMFVLIVTLITLVASYSIDTSYSYDYLGQYNDGTVLDCSDKNKISGPSVPKYTRGDINNNGVAYEIADMVLFTNYFIYGLGVFTIDQEIQIAATDVNRDGLTLSVADLMYLIRFVLGDALPLVNLEPVEAYYRLDVRGTIEVDIEIGAAALQLQGNVEPTLLADNMDIEYAFDAANNVTRVLIYNNTEKGQSFTGEFINTNGSAVVSIELATHEAQPVNASLLQTEFVLGQNSPDPFSNETVIPFAIPFASNVRFRITNDSGQVVFDFSQYYLAGISSFTWNGTNNYQLAVPDGIYYCTMFFEGHKKYIEMLLKR